MFAAAVIAAVGAAGALAATPPRGYSVICSNNGCELSASNSSPDRPAARSNTQYCIRPETGLYGDYTMARGQTLYSCGSADVPNATSAIASNATNATATINGNVIIPASGATLQGITVTGYVQVVGKQCTNTTIKDVAAHGGVMFTRRADQTSIDVDGSIVLNVTSKRHDEDNYPVVFAVAQGQVEIHCAPQTSAIIQAGRPSGPQVQLTERIGCLQVIDLGEMLGVYGSAIERVVQHVPPTDDETASRKMLTSLVLIFGTATALQLLLLA